MAQVEPSKAAASSLASWGTSSLAPMGLATLITALHFRPFQALPMVFAPLLAFSSYVNVAGFKIDSAGMTAAWSGLYALLALRRRQPLAHRFSARGLVRGSAIGLGAVNSVAGGWVYLSGNREKEKVERSGNRWQRPTE